MLKVGDTIPDFQLPDQNGKPVSPHNLKGTRWVLFFYPKDDSPGCTKQVCSLRDGYRMLKRAGFDVIGVSPDSVRRHQNFARKYTLPYRLLADPELDLIKKIGVWGPKKFMGREYDGLLRTTFIISDQGVIEHVIDKVITAEHSHQVLEIFSEKNSRP
jgi:peroxiredoxin Q/BCP